MSLQYLKTMPEKCAAGDAVIVISCESDESVCKAAVAAGIPIVNQEFILTGILKQEMNIDLYPLKLVKAILHLAGEAFL